jgi:hypothetical protein
MAMILLGHLQTELRCTKNAVVIAMFIMIFVGCEEAGQSDVYRESRAQAAKFDVQSRDDHLRIVTFLKLRDGTIERPKLYYF